MFTFTENEQVGVMNEQLLKLTLAMAVPVWIEKIRRLSAKQRQDRLIDVGIVLHDKSEYLLHKGSHEGDSAAAFNALAEGIALLSFSPGGVRTFGGHWETKETE